MSGHSQKCTIIGKESTPGAVTTFSVDLPSSENILGHHLTAIPLNPGVGGELLLGITYYAQAYDPELGIVGTAVSYVNSRISFHASAKYSAGSFTFGTLLHEFMAPIPFSLNELWRTSNSTWYKVPNGRYQDGQASWKTRLGRLFVDLKGGDADLSGWTFRTNVLIVE